MIPDVPREALEDAMHRFDAELRDTEQWADWQSIKAHKYAIEHKGQQYPVKKIVSLATDMPVSKFSGGEGASQANRFVEGREFQVVRLTSGNNPAWLRDELILALDLYLGTRPTPPGKHSEPIRELSELLNKLAKTLGLSDYDRYRNPNGVYMKLMNFRALDPDYTEQGKVGLSRGGKGDERVWNEFASDPERCHQVAEAIQAAIRAYQKRGTQIDEGDREDDYEAAEGHVLTVQHHRRERDSKIVGKKKAKVLRETGKLACEVCEFDFKESYGERGDGFIECHHTKPLYELEPGSKTKLNDLSLLCANCHRMVHAKMPWLELSDLRALLQAKAFIDD